ncbi:ArsR/SmtB family transcription factor [Streptomyces sp. NPDC014734]|uniref:ArsR/SmtB family transcription factor n=1 Tax=Streptomyces sp. NPDC014734 TaxID=3364886 RepID=UPI0036F86146
MPSRTLRATTPEIALLRVHFTPEDIGRVRVAAAPDPLWEIVNSFQALVIGSNPLMFGDWRRRARQRLTPACTLLGPLLPSVGYFPDFLTPDLNGTFDLDHAVGTVLDTPRSLVHAHLSELAAARRRSRPLPPVVRSLAEGSPEALHRLGTALHTYHRNALAPFWPRIRAQLEADLALRVRTLLRAGTDGLLGGFRPVLRWRPPVLEADYPVDRELRLDGRGLLLQPSFFCVRTPVTLASDEAAPVLVYPIQHTPGWARERESGLGSLIGSTRAAILEGAVTGSTTGELACRLGISAAAVSQHTAILRGAGLVLSVRRGKYVLHTTTSAGLALLDGRTPSPADR